MAGLRGTWVVTVLLICGAIQGGGVKFDIQQDTTSSVDPSQWFLAESHWTDICRYIDCWQGPSDLHVVDVFGASRAISKTFARRHYRAAAWDIKLSCDMDATTESGWYSLLNLRLRMLLDYLHNISYFFIIFVYCHYLTRYITVHPRISQYDPI